MFHELVGGKPPFSAFDSAKAVIKTGWPPAAVQTPSTRETPLALEEQVQIVTFGMLDGSVCAGRFALVRTRWLTLFGEGAGGMLRSTPARWLKMIVLVKRTVGV